MKYTRKYYKELDEKIKMIPLTYDYAFKSVMMKNIKIFKKYLIMTLNLNILEEETNLKFIDKELIKENYKEKGKTVDLNVKIEKNLLVTVEINRYNFENIKERNQLYLEKLHTMQFEVGDDYEDLKSIYLYQLNLNVLGNSNTGENIIVSYDITNHTIYNDKIKTYIKHLAYYSEMFYNNVVIMKYDEIFMAGLMADSFTKLYDIMSHILSNDEIKRFMECVVDMSKKYFNVHEWEKEKMDKLVQDTAREIGFKNGLEEGREKGIEEGREKGIEEGREKGRKEGIKQKSIEMIKKMLKNNLDYDLISKISDKSIDEIKEIEKTI